MSLEPQKRICDDRLVGIHLDVDKFPFSSTYTRAEAPIAGSSTALGYES